MLGLDSSAWSPLPKAEFSSWVYLSPIHAPRIYKSPYLVILWLPRAHAVDYEFLNTVLEAF